MDSGGFCGGYNARYILLKETAAIEYRGTYPTLPRVHIGVYQLIFLSAGGERSTLNHFLKPCNCFHCIHPFNCWAHGLWTQLTDFP